jgi:hypothetical protein
LGWPEESAIGKPAKGCLFMSINWYLVTGFLLVAFGLLSRAASF